jgi:peptidoglycan/xylan/chitin deacetylase (PgdA/CDA1 family)
MLETSREFLSSLRDVAVPVLMYHQVSPSPEPSFRRYTVTVREFSRQMRWLATFGYRTIDMDTLVRARAGQGPLPKRPVLITFDDGFQGCVDHALPVLQANGFTAVFYLVSGHMGKTSRWLVAELGLDLPIMSWPTARALVADGFQCGAHTVTHPHLTGLDPAQCRAELVDARMRLEDELGRSIVHLAYPYGSYDPEVRQRAVEAGYITACSTQAGLSAPGDDPLALHRVSIYGHDTLIDFACRLRTGTALRQGLGWAVDAISRRLHGRIGSRA